MFPPKLPVTQAATNAKITQIQVAFWPAASFLPYRAWEKLRCEMRVMCFLGDQFCCSVYFLLDFGRGARPRYSRKVLWCRPKKRNGLHDWFKKKCSAEFFFREPVHIPIHPLLGNMCTNHIRKGGKGTRLGRVPPASKLVLPKWTTPWVWIPVYREWWSMKESLWPSQQNFCGPWK